MSIMIKILCCLLAYCFTYIGVSAVGYILKLRDFDRGFYIGASVVIAVYITWICYGN